MMRNVNLFLAIMGALFFLPCPAISQDNSPLCTRSQELILRSFTENSRKEPRPSYIVLMEHAFAGCIADGAQTGQNRCLGEASRHLCEAGQAERMAHEIGDVLDASGNAFTIGAILTSQVCRTIETANFILPILNPKKRTVAQQPALNPLREQRKTLDGAVVLTKAQKDMRIFENSANWIRQLAAKPGEVTILVSHSDIIPELVPRLDENGHGIVRPIEYSESVFLMKTESGYRCIGTIPCEGAYCSR